MGAVQPGRPRNPKLPRPQRKSTVRYLRPSGSTGPKQFVGPLPWSALHEHQDPDNLPLCARFIVMQMANEVLDRATSWRLLFDPETDAIAPYVVPSNLVGALWIQLSQSMTGERAFVRCKQCGRWLSISPDTHRTNRELCSERCKSAAYRTRKQRARELTAQGMKPAAIAREVGSTTKVVRGWLRG